MLPYRENLVQNNASYDSRLTLPSREDGGRQIALYNSSLIKIYVSSGKNVARKLRHVILARPKYMLASRKNRSQQISSHNTPGPNLHHAYC